ncbi:MAG: tRNA (N(6)-L-threonylcarbamoyladenosine(37)-C(2))-methylthiotransferase MtaB [Clostridia bacterium]|nr:tRNA (N(6)-L-threonylcarbamoyladenosine(37)-C(2))-methylthiotransferase MtaB [Clostridia bacterium]
MKIAFHTLGCKVNQYETQAMRKLMEAAGWETAEFSVGKVDADVLVVNSCTVTGESDRKLRQLLRRCRRENPTAVLVLTGCMPQAYPAAAADLVQADIVLGNAARRDLPVCVAEYLTHRERIVRIPPHEKAIEPLDIDAFQGRTRAYVKIQDGCNRFCSYCIIPYARGRVRSRQPDDIRKELTRLAAAGYKEIVLVGINLTAYGQDNGLSIADAVEAACQVEGIERVRLGSLEPDFMTDEVLARLAACDKLCPQFHVALQSGCDDTLRRMNRHYDTALFADLCYRLRQLFPACAITTDVMVGFPGESEEEFRRSMEFVKKIDFSQAHVFSYSRRPGTVADRMTGQVPAAVKAARSRQLIAVCEESARRYAAAYIGKQVNVLLETPHEDGTVTGHTDTYLTVRVNTSCGSGELIPVTITAFAGNELIGEEA